MVIYLKVGENRKMAAHNLACHAVGVALFETLGGWNEEAIVMISKIGRLLGQRLGLLKPLQTGRCLVIALLRSTLPPYHACTS